MQSINPAAEDDAADDAEDDPEKRYNHNHGSDGRFTTGSGASGVDNGHKGGKIGAGKKTKYAPSPQRQKKGLQLKPDEYTRLCGAFNTAHPSAMNDDGVHIFDYGDYIYRVQPDGYGGLTVWDKQNIIATKRRK